MVTMMLTTFLFCTVSALPYRVAVVPLSIDSAEGLSVLRDGIQEMLCLRLVKNDTTVIVAGDEIEQTNQSLQAFTGQSKALMIGVKVKADYVVYGALKASDSAVNVELRVIDVTGGTPAVVYARTCGTRDDVLPNVNQIAGQIRDRFGRGEVRSSLDSSLGKSTVLQKEDSAAQAAKPPSGSDMQKTGTDTLFAFWKSPTLQICINGIAVRDMDNDGKQELVILTQNEVQLYRHTSSDLKKVGTAGTVRFKYPVGIDIADINGNGLPEIFISALDRYQERVLSTVLEYDGKQSSLLVKNLPWLLRVVTLHDTMTMLLGQKIRKNTLYAGEISQMKWDNGKLKPQKQLVPSEGVNVLGSAYGIVLNRGGDNLAGSDKSGHLNIISESGEKITETEETFGGSTFYFQLIESSTEKTWEYLPARIIVADVNADGRNEICAAKNHEVIHNILSKFKYYNNGHIEVLAWDGQVLKAIWKSASQSGFIRDIAIGDFDNDGKKELVAALIYREGKSLFAKPKSTIIAYELN